MIELMEAFNEGRIDIGFVDRFGERLHTPISNMWKELRQFMYFKDAPDSRLVELDISNSQPYFSSLCVNPNVIRRLLPEFSVCASFLEQLDVNDDCKHYSYLCRTGKIYETWAALRKIDRDSAKDEFIRSIMFSRNRPTRLEVKKARNHFRMVFPTVDRMFAYIKSLDEIRLPFMTSTYTDHYGRFEGRKSYFKNLSCAMQRIESRVFIKAICPALITLGIPRFLTVHDSIIVEERYAEQARRVMQEQFEMLAVRPPFIKIKVIERL